MYNTEISQRMSQNSNNTYKSVKDNETINRKSIVMLFNYNLTKTTTLGKFLNKIKPLPGVLIFLTPNWDEFPESKEDAIKMSKEWTMAFSKKKSHKNVTVNVYFDLEGKSITFKVRPFNLVLKEFEECENFIDSKNKITEDVVEIVNKNDILQKKEYEYSVPNCSDYPNSTDYISESKDLAHHIESNIGNELNKTYGIVIFMKNRKIKVTIKRRLCINVCDDIVTIVETENKEEVQNIENLENKEDKEIKQDISNLNDTEIASV